MMSRLFPECTFAPTLSASAFAFAGLRSAVAMKFTAGCSDASRARSVPMRPEPITANPMLLRCIAYSTLIFAASDGCTVYTNGCVATTEIGAKSFSVSYGNFAYSAGA